MAFDAHELLTGKWQPKIYSIRQKKKNNFRQKNYLDSFSKVIFFFFDKGSIWEQDTVILTMDEDGHRDKENHQTTWKVIKGPWPALKGVEYIPNSNAFRR